MRLHLLNRASLQNSSFTVTYNRYSHFLKVWHYHPELELVYIAKSTGTRFIGDGIEKFSEGDLVLIGKNLPHMWLNDEIYFETDSGLESDIEPKKLDNLIKLMNVEIENLPPKCKEIFLMNKKEGLTHTEISEYLNISIKTVEGHITRAFKILTEKLGTKMEAVLFYFLISINKKDSLV